MAESPSHKFGQLVGNLLEDILEPELASFCSRKNLYLDKRGERVGVRSGKKVSWKDKFGNVHDLDFVIEKGGTSECRGRPVAFIEAAWRRYTKHSRNKAQEIQAALLPIAEEYHFDIPFLGVVLAGVFTANSITQMKSVGFHVLYFPYGSMVAAFESVGIDVQFEENTPDDHFAKCVEKIHALNEDSYQALKGYLVSNEQALFNDFFNDLELVVDRLIESVLVIPLFGVRHEYNNVREARRFLESFDEAESKGKFEEYKIIVSYSNGDKIDANFKSSKSALNFLSYVGG